MKLSITQNDTVISSVYFNDNIIKETVTFWTNIQYQSPQFPLDLSPTINQLDQLYPNGLIPQISTGNDTTLQVLTDSTILQEIKIVQMKVIDTGFPYNSNWSSNFDITNWTITPDGTAYIQPSAAPFDSILLNAGNTAIDLAYQVLISFKISGDSQTIYFGNIDPLIRITNQSGG